MASADTFLSGGSFRRGRRLDNWCIHDRSFFSSKAVLRSLSKATTLRPGWIFGGVHALFEQMAKLQQRRRIQAPTPHSNRYRRKIRIGLGYHLDSRSSTLHRPAHTTVKRSRTRNILSIPTGDVRVDQREVWARPKGFNLAQGT